MKILVDCTPLRGGGGVQVAIAFLEGLSRTTGIEWRAVLSGTMVQPVSGRKWATPERIQFITKTSKLDFIRASRYLKRIEGRFAPDVVFTVFGPAYFKAKAPHVVGFALPNLIYDRDGPLARLDNLTTRTMDALRCQSLRAADHIMVETETVKQRLAPRIHYPLSQISVVPNAVNPLLQAFAPSPSVPGGRFRLLVPSAYYVHKNLEIIPAVAQDLRQTAPDFDFEFVLTLDARSAPFRAIMADAKVRGVAGNISTRGVLKLDALARAYSECSAVFLPTLREASTAVYPESFYFQRPLITSDMDFARELCGDAAIFVPPLNASAIATGILKLANDPALARTLVEIGAAQLETRYPTPQEKFDLQLDVLRKAAKCAPPQAVTALSETA